MGDVTLCRYKLISALSTAIYVYSSTHTLSLKASLAVPNIFLFHRNVTLQLFRTGNIASMSRDIASAYLNVHLQSSSAGIRYSTHLLGIHIAYSHSVYIRLFAGYITLSSAVIVLGLLQAMMLGIASFYHCLTVTII